MESLVSRRKGLEVLRLHEGLLLRQEALKPCNEPRIRRKGQGPYDLEFKCFPQEVRLMGEGQVNGTHHGGMLREYFDQAVVLKPKQRIPDRRGTETEFLLKGVPVEDR